MKIREMLLAGAFRHDDDHQCIYHSSYWACSHYDAGSLWSCFRPVCFWEAA